MSKDELIGRLNKIEEADKVGGGFNRLAKITEWNNYGKSRTYLKMVETREGSKHYNEKDYGYYDNTNNLYVPGKFDLESSKIYGFSGTLLNI